VADPEKCKACRICEQVCPDCAIAIVRKARDEKEN
ncbi:MAG: 4Fe-4S binding protein, partial [Fastidiosipilaceae bacterium]